MKLFCFWSVVCEGESVEINAETFTTVRQSHQVKVLRFDILEDWDDARIFNNTGLFAPIPVKIIFFMLYVYVILTFSYTWTIE